MMKKHIQLWLCLLFPFMISCQNRIFENDLSKILGVNKVDVENSTSFDEFGGFGEGYTLEVYKLSKKTVKEFIKNPQKVLLEKQETGKNWQKKDWSQTPINIDNSYEAVLTLALNYDNGDVKLGKRLEKMKKILEKPNVYYAFYYNPNKSVKEYIEDVQFFILDIEERQLYIIESNI